MWVLLFCEADVQDPIIVEKKYIIGHQFIMKRLQKCKSKEDFDLFNPVKVDFFSQAKTANVIAVHGKYA